MAFQINNQTTYYVRRPTGGSTPMGNASFTSVTVALNTDNGGSLVMITLYWSGGSDTVYLSDHQHTNLSDICDTYTCYYDNQGGYNSKPLKVLYASKELQLWSRDNSNYIQFEMTGQFAATGNIQSLLNYSDECTPYCFYRLFANCTSLTSAPKLPATNLAPWCYAWMFAQSSLISATELPATTLANNCYANMFYGSSLTTAPELPATTLAEGCYQYMFAWSGLTSAPELPATTLAPWCYYTMFAWSGLTSAPELPATTLAPWCYEQMFNGCTSLNYIKVGFTEWFDLCTQNWVNGVASEGTFVKPEQLPGIRGTSNIPKNWTVENS